MNTSTANALPTFTIEGSVALVTGANGGGAILNVLSAQSWFACPGTNGYHAAKAAQWGLTNGVRLELDDPALLNEEIRNGVV